MKVLIVDLNNFSRYPTLSVGYLTAVLQQSGIEVKTFSPLFFGIHGFPRRVQEPPGLHYAKIINHVGATSTNATIQQIHQRIKKLTHTPPDDTEKILQHFQEQLTGDIDIVLISAYTMYFKVCAALAAHCAELHKPLLIGGNSFVFREITQQWLGLRGVTAVFAGEPEHNIAALLEDIVTGRSIEHYPGICLKHGEHSVAPPLHDLDKLPFPDFSAFPWESYPNRIIPIMTARGCEWGRCSFCSDIVTSAGRTFRTRSLDNVLAEISHQRTKHQASLFVFLDLKLNSDLELWRGLIREIPRVAPGIKWTASVHVDARKDNGLSAQDLKLAAKAGLVRITCGLESGSQRVLNTMAKGVRVARLSEFVRDARSANLSVRLTSIIGEPTEMPEDIDLTRRFLTEHRDAIERIVVNRFAYQPGTAATNKLLQQRGDKSEIDLLDLDTLHACYPSRNVHFSRWQHVKAVFRLLRTANTINRKPLIAHAQEFEGAF